MLNMKDGKRQAATSEEQTRMEELKGEIEQLSRDEEVIEQHQRWIQMSLRNMLESKDNHEHSYVHRSHIAEIAGQDLTIALQTRLGTHVRHNKPDVSFGRFDLF